MSRPDRKASIPALACTALLLLAGQAPAAPPSASAQIDAIVTRAFAATGTRAWRATAFRD